MGKECRTQIVIFSKLLGFGDEDLKYGVFMRWPRECWFIAKIVGKKRQKVVNGVLWGTKAWGERHKARDDKRTYGCDTCVSSCYFLIFVTFMLFWLKILFLSIHFMHYLVCYCTRIPFEKNEVHIPMEFS